METKAASNSSTVKQDSSTWPHRQRQSPACSLRKSSSRELLLPRAIRAKEREGPCAHLLAKRPVDLTRRRKEPAHAAAVLAAFEVVKHEKLSELPWLVLNFSCNSYSSSPTPSLHQERDLSTPSCQLGEVKEQNQTCQRRKPLIRTP